MFAAGEIVGSIKFRNVYGQYALIVLSSYLEEVKPPRTAGPRVMERYKILKDTPTKEEYQNLRNVYYTVSADSLMSQAYEEIATLAEEMRSWYDNLSENLQQGERAERIDDAASTLENVTAQDAVEVMGKIDVLFLPDLDLGSRAKRAAEAASMLTSVANALREFSENQGQADEDEGDEDLESIASQCETDASEVENVEFPTMFG